MSDSPYTSTCSGAVDTNYTINYVPGVVTVNPAPLTITAASEQVTYGATVPAIIPQYSGFVNGDSASSLSSQPTCTTTATSASSPSPPYYSTWCSGASDPNYTISYADGALNVAQKALTISAVTQTKVYDGTINSNQTPIQSGLVSGDSFFAGQAFLS